MIEARMFPRAVGTLVSCRKAFVGAGCSQMESTGTVGASHTSFAGDFDMAEVLAIVTAERVLLVLCHNHCSISNQYFLSEEHVCCVC